jgi:hypothetical protein
MSTNALSRLMLFAIVLTLGGCASGSAIVTGKTKAPVTPNEVRLYLEPPAAFEVIGLVSASSDSGLTDQQSVDYAVAELKKQAGKLGANGVLLMSSGESTSGYVVGSSYAIPVIAKSVQGKAIFVKLGDGK